MYIQIFLHIYVYTCIYIYIHMYLHVHIPEKEWWEDCSSTALCLPRPNFSMHVRARVCVIECACVCISVSERVWQREYVRVCACVRKQYIYWCIYTCKHCVHNISCKHTPTQTQVHPDSLHTYNRERMLQAIMQCWKQCCDNAVVEFMHNVRHSYM